MDYRKTAQEIYDHVGKKENIISAAHCATRLRLVIADNDKADKEYVENIDSPYDFPVEYRRCEGCVFRTGTDADHPGDRSCKQGL